jgi:hypothetical protein
MCCVSFSRQFAKRQIVMREGFNPTRKRMVAHQVFRFPRCIQKASLGLPSILLGTRNAREYHS